MENPRGEESVRPFVGQGILSQRSIPLSRITREGSVLTSSRKTGLPPHLPDCVYKLGEALEKACCGRELWSTGSHMACRLDRGGLPMSTGAGTFATATPWNLVSLM